MVVFMNTGIKSRNHQLQTGTQFEPLRAMDVMERDIALSLHILYHPLLIVEEPEAWIIHVLNTHRTLMGCK